MNSQESLWYENHDNLVMTAHYMADQGDDGHQIARFIEKPWNYEDQYLRAWAAYIVEAESDGTMNDVAAAASWKALQARCPHPNSYDDDEDGKSCDICVKTLVSA